MIIVDEAHHLAWSEQEASPDYAFVEQLALRAPSLILLTATPEQLGKESHFARLRLLDPDRFYSFSEFLAEEKQFEPVAEAAKALLNEQTLAVEARALLADLLKADNVSGLLNKLDDDQQSAMAREALIKILLDHHGTGRILFRNSRQTVQGFPARECHAYPLTGQANDADLQQDPRYLWLADKIKQLGEQKALLICKHADTAMQLEQTLKNRAGIASAVFHEGMTIIERDRAAAYFADQDSNARLLICSEIGSEGRNFQFVHHLVLWDLPKNPDLLQQRIGRLDRIGQKHTIQIHVPYLQDSEQAVLFRWYDEGMNAFRINCSAAQPVADKLRTELDELLTDKQPALINAFIAKTQTLGKDIELQLHNGRDILLELNSFRKDVADELIMQLKYYEQERNLWPYLEALFECYGVDTEFHSPECFIVKPSDHLRISHFPGLDEDGRTVTISRDCALAREDMQFMTWEHPMVSAAMDLILSSETGNAVISVTKHPNFKAGQFLLECLFVAECSAPAELQIGRFLPPTPIRILIDQHKNDLTDSIVHEDLPDIGARFDKHQIIAFFKRSARDLNEIIS
ncbi:helicase-related protein [Methylocucumis oryzae]|uniref:helicase-related protein n=1 Tax=Methylocucumis oryzae TaxID=1632867 RepID=UPI000AE41C81